MLDVDCLGSLNGDTIQPVVGKIKNDGVRLTGADIPFFEMEMATSNDKRVCIVTHLKRFVQRHAATAGDNPEKVRYLFRKTEGRRSNGALSGLQASRYVTSSLARQSWA